MGGKQKEKGKELWRKLKGRRGEKGGWGEEGRKRACENKTKIARDV